MVSAPHTKNYFRFALWTNHVIVNTHDILLRGRSTFDTSYRRHIYVAFTLYIRPIYDVYTARRTYVLYMRVYTPWLRRINTPYICCMHTPYMRRLHTLHIRRRYTPYMYAVHLRRTPYMLTQYIYAECICRISTPYVYTSYTPRIHIRRMYTA